MTAELWLHQLEQNGYRLTPARQAVVRALAASPYAITPLELFETARRRHRPLGLVSVYRTLEKLEQLGLIQRVHQPEGCQAFVSATHGHQHLLICRQCGRTAFFEGDDLQPLIRSISRRTGFSIGAHWLQLVWPLPGVPVRHRAGPKTRRHDARSNARRSMSAGGVAADRLRPDQQLHRPAESTLPTVLATETFLADMAQNVAGDRLVVDALIPPGLDPHEFQPAPQDAIKIERAQVLIINGLGYESWMTKTAAELAEQKVVIVATAGLTPRSDPTGEHPDGDPHMWMSPRNAIHYVENIRDGLSKADPAGAALYSANADAYIARLRDLDARMQAQIDQIPPKSRLLVTNHDALGYFARDYGFTVVGAVIPSLSPGRGSLCQGDERPDRDHPSPAGRQPSSSTSAKTGSWRTRLPRRAAPGSSPTCTWRRSRPRVAPPPRTSTCCYMMQTTIVTALK